MQRASSGVYLSVISGRASTRFTRVKVLEIETGLTVRSEWGDELVNDWSVVREVYLDRQCSDRVG